MMVNWKIEKRKISELKPYHKNPRKISKEQFTHLQTSLEKFGLIDKPVINTDNTIIGGHQRVQALKRMKVKEVEVYVPEDKIGDSDLQELSIRLNKNIGDWDYDILANEWNVGCLMDWGFTEEELSIDRSIVEQIETAEQQSKEKKMVTCPSCGMEF